MSIDPENIKFEAEFKKAINGTMESALEVVFKANQYNFGKLNQSVGVVAGTLDDHLENHRVKDEKNKAIKGVLVRAGAGGVAVLGLLIAYLGLMS